MNEIDAIHTDIVKLTAQSDKLSKASKELRDKKTPVSNILANYIDTHNQMIKDYISTCHLRLNSGITQEQFNQICNMWIKSVLSISDIIATLNGESGIIKYTNKLN